MTLPYAGEEPPKQSNEEKAKAIVNLFILETVVIIVSGAGYLYLSFVLDWDPVIAFIPFVIILLLSGSYTAWKVQKFAAGADIIAKQGSALSSRGDYPASAPLVTQDKKKAKNDEPEKTGTGRKKRFWIIWIIVLFLIFCQLIIDVIDHYYPDYLSDQVTSIVGIGLIISFMVFGSVYIQDWLRDKPQPSEESYNALLKHAIGIIVADVIIILGCFILGSMYGGTHLLLLAVLAVCFISIWYLASKMRSLGLMS